MTRSPKQPQGHACAAFAHRDYRFFALQRLLGVIGWQMQSVAIGWQVYNLTLSTMSLAWVGLSQFLPIVGFSLITGHVADRLDRRRVARACLAAQVACSLALAWMSGSGRMPMGLVYAILFCTGTARAFQAPANQALLPALVPREHFANAVAWNATLFQCAALVGPTLGGIGYAAGGPTAVYLTTALACVGAMLGVTAIHPHAGAALEKTVVSWRSALAGIHYIRAQKIVFGCMSLDLFAVLLGGATALLPVYARDILRVGPWGQGFLRSAPAVGAIAVGVAMARVPTMRRAGPAMLASVAGFGVATILFGVSRQFYFSLACLAAIGGLDMISVVIRQTMIQTLTPRQMLGRVNAVNMVFIGASNELGEFESGLTASWLGGAVPAVVAGGVGTIVIVALWAWLFPQLRRVDRIGDMTTLGEHADEAPEASEAAGA
jgi:MFS family permease